MNTWKNVVVCNCLTFFLYISWISELAFIAPETKKVLERLSHMPDVNVTVISGREMEDLTRKVNFGHFGRMLLPM